MTDTELAVGLAKTAWQNDVRIDATFRHEEVYLAVVHLGVPAKSWWFVTYDGREYETRECASRDAGMVLFMRAIEKVGDF